MSLVRRGAELCPLERGDVSIKKAQKGEVSKNKTSPSPPDPASARGRQEGAWSCLQRTREL